VYLVSTKRLFGVRGGKHAYEARLRSESVMEAAIEAAGAERAEAAETEQNAVAETDQNAAPEAERNAAPDLARATAEADTAPGARGG
jgi:RecB family exonuclease